MASIFDTERGEQQQAVKVRVNQAGFSKLEKVLESYSFRSSDFLVGCESTGHVGETLLRRLQADGMAVYPDAMLNQLPPVSGHKLVMVPGPNQCVAALLAEPRVHRLLAETVSRGRHVAATAAAQESLLNAAHFSLETIDRVKLQGRRKLKDFVVDLLDLLLAPAEAEGVGNGGET